MKQSASKLSITTEKRKKIGTARKVFLSPHKLVSSVN